jgi:hypothetical protein
LRNLVQLDILCLLTARLACGYRSRLPQSVRAATLELSDAQISRRHLLGAGSKCPAVSLCVHKCSPVLSVVVTSSGGYRYGHRQSVDVVVAAYRLSRLSPAPSIDSSCKYNCGHSFLSSSQVGSFPCISLRLGQNHVVMDYSKVANVSMVCPWPGRPCLIGKD